MPTITVEQEQKRINQLIKLDDKSSKQSDQYYDEALAYISDHLTEFFAHYAVANNLTLTQVNQRVSKWDLAQWQACIDELETDDWLPETKKKAKAIGIIAGISVRSMMTAIVGMAVINMINKRIALINERADADRKAEIDRMGKLIGDKGIDAKKADKAIIKSASKEKAKEPDNKPKNGPNSLNKPQQTGDSNSSKERPKPAKKASEEPKEVDRPTVSDRLWIDGDQMMNDLENMLLDMLKGNMSLEDLRDSLREHANPDQFDPGKSMADRLKQENYIIDRLIRTESARMKDRTNDYYFKQNGIKYVNFVCEPGACNKCLAIAAGGPYLLDEAPKIPDETHPNCRCGKVPAMDLDDKITQEPFEDYQYKGNSFDSSFKQQTSPQFVQAVESILKNAPENMQKLFEKYANQVSIVGFRKPGTGSRFYPGEGIRLDMNEVMGDRIHHKYDALFHEYAHGIDYMSRMGMLTSDGELAKRIVADANNILSKGEDYVAEFNRQFIQVPESMRGDISDMLSGATNDKLNGQLGHKATYWDENGSRLSAEAFAEMTSATINNPESLEYIKMFLPNAYEYYLKMIEEVTQ